jgi:hypothetical protein
MSLGKFCVPQKRLAPPPAHYAFYAAQVVLSVLIINHVGHLVSLNCDGVPTILPLAATSKIAHLATVVERQVFVLRDVLQNESALGFWHSYVAIGQLFAFQGIILFVSFLSIPAFAGAPAKIYILAFGLAAVWFVVLANLWPFFVFGLTFLLGASALGFESLTNKFVWRVGFVLLPFWITTPLAVFICLVD